MDKILGVFGGGVTNVLNQRNDDDFVSRLSCVYSTALCVLFAIIVSSKQYVGEPITCWVPAHFSGPHESYTNTYCWIRNTYYHSFEENLPRADEEHQMIPYYQWMPMILLIQALLFYLPILMWRSLSASSGLRLDSLLDTGHFYENVEDPDNQQKLMTGMVTQMDTVLNSQQDNLKTKCTLSLKHILSRTICACCGRRQGNYLTVLYIFTKFLFIATALGQLFALNFFLGYKYHAYGIDVIRAIANKEDWQASPRFPRVTMCDFKVRRIGNIHDYTVQCVLPINLFNEKIYLFLWFWLVFLSIATIYSFFSWIFQSGISAQRRSYIKKQLTLAGKTIDSRHLDGFLDEYLRSDGVFMLRLFAKNRNPVTTTDLIGELWEKYKTQDTNREHLD